MVSFCRRFYRLRERFVRGFAGTFFALVWVGGDFMKGRDEISSLCFLALTGVFLSILAACGRSPEADTFLLQFGRNALVTLKTAPDILLNPKLTPGTLCTEADPDFDGFRYPEHIAHCKRHITSAMKDTVAKAYGVPKSDYSLYEFDHFLPLAIGGKNDIANLWPQRLDGAKQKDVLELSMYNEMKKGAITQEAAVLKIREWHVSPK